jgi:hypothetical protein
MQMHGNTKLAQLNKLINAQGMIEMYERMGKPDQAEWWRNEYKNIFRRVYGS